MEARWRVAPAEIHFSVSIWVHLALPGLVQLHRHFPPGASAGPRTATTTTPAKPTRAPPRIATFHRLQRPVVFCPAAGAGCFPAQPGPVGRTTASFPRPRGELLGKAHGSLTGKRAEGGGGCKCEGRHAAVVRARPLWPDHSRIGGGRGRVAPVFLCPILPAASCKYPSWLLRRSHNNNTCNDVARPSPNQRPCQPVSHPRHPSPSGRRAHCSGEERPRSRRPI